MSETQQGRAQYRVLLSNRGNPDHRQDPDAPVSGTGGDHYEPVHDFAHASRLCQLYRDAHQLGGGNWSGGQICDATGMVVARVAYNGRVFAVGEPMRLLEEAADVATFVDHEDFAGDAALQRYDLATQDDGSIRGTVWTNDNLDHGVPSEIAEWNVTYADRAAMDRGAGRSRTGISGVKVIVILDGQRI